MALSLWISDVWVKGKSFLLIFFPFAFGFPTGRPVSWRSTMGVSKLLSDDRNSSLQSNLSTDQQTYTSWLRKHPCALESFEKMMKGAKGKKIVVFLDYDGTLSPIVDDPDRAFMSLEMRAGVREVGKCFPTAIISGRSRDKVKEFVKLNNVYYAGSHGMDIMPPTSDNEVGEEVAYQPAKKFLPTVQQIKAVLEEEIGKIVGAVVEDNRFCVSVHYRHVREEDLKNLEENVESVLEKYPDFHVTQGKKVIEIRPTINWNKGHAVEYYIHILGHTNSKDILPVYIGDDRTDEDAFKAIERRGGEGIGILVSSIPKQTKACYTLKDPSQVLVFLQSLARWKQASSIINSNLIK